MLDRKLIDREFPTLGDVIFLNSALVMVPARSAADAYIGYFTRCMETFGDSVVPYWTKEKPEIYRIIADARTAVAELINADPAEIAFTKNTAESMGVFAGGYPFTKDDSILTTDQEHPSNLFCLIGLREKTGVRLDVVRSDNLGVDAEAFIARFTPRTKAVVISAVQFTSGTYVDMRKLGRACREHGVLFVVDGIQAAGRMNIDVEEMCIDYMGCGAHKGLLATTGSGFTYCRSSLIESITPQLASYHSVILDVEPPALTDNYDSLTWRKTAERFEAGNPNYAGIAALGAGCRVLNALGMQAIEDHIFDLQEYLLKKISGLPLRFRTPLEGPGKIAGILCIYYDTAKEQEILAILKERRIYLTLRGGYMRISLGFHNTRDEMDSVAEAFEKIAAL